MQSGAPNVRYMTEGLTHSMTRAGFEPTTYRLKIKISISSAFPLTRPLSPVALVEMRYRSRLPGCDRVLFAVQDALDLCEKISRRKGLLNERKRCEAEARHSYLFRVA